MIFYTYGEKSRRRPSTVEITRSKLVPLPCSIDPVPAPRELPETTALPGPEVEALFLRRPGNDAGTEVS